MNNYKQIDYVRGLRGYKKQSNLLKEILTALIGFLIIWGLVILWLV